MGPKEICKQFYGNGVTVCINLEIQCLLCAAELPAKFVSLSMFLEVHVYFDIPPQFFF